MFAVTLLCALLLLSCDSAPGSSDTTSAPIGTESQSQTDKSIETSGSDPAMPSSGADTQLSGSPGGVPVSDADLLDEAAPVLGSDPARRAADSLRAQIDDPEQTGNAWSLIGRLPRASAKLFAEDIEDEAGGGNILNSQRLSALLAVEPAAAQAYIAEGLAAGEPASFMSLKDHSEVGRKLLGAVELAPDDTKQANLCLDLLRTWGGAVPGDVPLLRQLALSEDKTVVYRATGHLLALGEGGDAEYDALRQAVRGQTDGWVGAIEGIKISGDGRFAGVLVPLASQAGLLGDDAGAGESAAEAGETDFAEKSTVRMAAYALTYLPGEQASLMRTRLLSARSPRVRWQARLGELLHGNPTPWHSGIVEEGFSNPEMWTALEPPEARHGELLPLYAAVAHGDDALLQARAAAQLNRYNDIASGDRVARILSRLIVAGGLEHTESAGSAQLVRYKALETAGDLRLPQLFEQAQGIMDNAEDNNTLCRPLAAYYLLAVGRLPESGPGRDEKGGDG